MRSRAWVLVVVSAALLAAGCWHSCRCCGPRDRILPQRLKNERPFNPWDHEGPPAKLPDPPPAAGTKATGAYGGS
jgi:hypothetical protein